MRRKARRDQHRGIARQHSHSTGQPSSRGYVAFPGVETEWNLVPVRLNEAKPNGLDTALSENALRDAVLHQSVECLRHLLLVRLLPVVRHGRDEVNRSRAALGRPRTPLSIGTHSSPLSVSRRVAILGRFADEDLAADPRPPLSPLCLGRISRKRTLPSFPRRGSFKTTRGPGRRFRPPARKAGAALCTWKSFPERISWRAPAATRM